MQATESLFKDSLVVIMREYNKIVEESVPCMEV